MRNNKWNLDSYHSIVAGLGMVTPLGCGVETTWERLTAGWCGVRAITLEDLKMDGFDRDTQLHTFDQLASKVAAIVPCGTNVGEFNEELWLNSKVGYNTFVLLATKGNIFKENSELSYPKI